MSAGMVRGGNDRDFCRAALAWAEIHDQRVAKHDPHPLGVPDEERADLERLGALCGRAGLRGRHSREGRDGGGQEHEKTCHHVLHKMRAKQRYSLRDAPGKVKRSTRSGFGVVLRLVGWQGVS